uniref:Centrosomal protein 128 n=1 Tax=Periophthalmus magnuspinnatus TaxID=409849 RepID=A0A3B3Z824_9GOBI
MSSSMNTSSESDTYERTRGQRVRGRRQSRDRGRARDAPTSEISSKISTLANTLQSTSKNLNKVDRMLGQYREHTDDQAEAMALLRENLEDSISQLQAQRLSGRSGTKSASASASPLHTSDLDLYSESGTTLWDLRSDQQRLADDLGREILRRNRADIDTRRAMENLSEHMTASQRQDAVSCVKLPHLFTAVIVTERSDLEKEVSELKEQLRRASVMGEVEELKRALAREEKEKSQLSLQVQGCENAEKRQLEEMLEDSKRSRDELKSKAQEAIRQWRAKCKRLQREREEVRNQTRPSGERESSHAQMKALSQQTEAARRELAEILGRLAHREEELRRKDVELSDSRQRQLSLEQEQEARNQVAVHKRLKEENQRLEERMESQVHRQQKDEEQHTELQNTVKQVTSSHAQLVQRLSEEESLRKELQKSHSELRDKLMSVQEERAALGKQLQLQREVHQKELDNMKVYGFYSNAASDRELCEALRIKLDRMKDECDKLAAQLSSKEDAHSLLQRKHQLLREELDHKVSTPCPRSSKVRWLCEEVRERNKREQSLRRQHQHTKDQLKALRHSQDSEQADLLQRLDQQEKLLHSLSNEKHGMPLQTDNHLIQAALDRLEAIPEKQSLMDNFKDLEESQRQREEVEQRYSKYKEIVWDLQNQLDESKRKIQEYREEKLDATSRSLRLAALSSSIKGPGAFLSSSLRSDSLCGYLYNPPDTASITHFDASHVFFTLCFAG